MQRLQILVQIRLITRPDCGTPEVCQWPGRQERGRGKKMQGDRESGLCLLHDCLYSQWALHSVSTDIQIGTVFPIEIIHTSKQVDRLETLRLFLVKMLIPGC